MAQNPGVGKKIGILEKEEGKPRKQAIAMALSMNRAGRLTRGGDYIRAGKRKSSGRSMSRQ